MAPLSFYVLSRPFVLRFDRSTRESRDFPSSPATPGMSNPDRLAELAQVRADGAEQVAASRRGRAGGRVDLRKVVEAMKASAAELRAREAALEAKIEAVQAEAMALRDRPWWR